MPPRTPSSRRARRAGAALLALAAALAPAAASAHRFAPSLLEVRETQPGRLAVRWRTPLQRVGGALPEPRLPAGCREHGEPRVARDAVAAELAFEARCESALAGSRLGVDGLAASGTQALLRVELVDGRRYQALLGEGRPDFRVPLRAAPAGVLSDYLALGARHILEGLDHLAFVLGLVLLVPPGRRLVATITAFTVGHSVTLSLAALGWIGFPSQLVELAIAASIVALAVELTRDAPGALARAPWAMAAGFGLLHGMGFAGALAEIGLPQEEIPLALFAFNAGIEAGQLAFVALALLAGALLRPLARRAPIPLGRVGAYAIGSLAAYWCFERAAGLL